MHAGESRDRHRVPKAASTTRPRARVYADNPGIGRTPATVSTEVRASKVVLPR
jgi:hypothetical protein